MLLKVYKSRVWILLFMLMPFISYAQPWAVVENPTSAIYAITRTTTFDGVVAPVSGDYFGTFFMNGEDLVCAGYQMWPDTGNIAVTAFGNDTIGTGGVKNGFTDGDMVYWKIWYAASGEEVVIVSDPEFLWENFYMGDVLEFSNSECVCGLEIPVVSGWNWISFNCLPEGGLINDVLANYVAANGDILKNATVPASYYGGTWYPTNMVISPDYRYLLKRLDPGAGSVVVDGVCIDPTVPIDLVSGWNWLGYKPGASQLVNDAFTVDPPPANGDILKSSTTPMSYYGGVWYPNTASMDPGVGYLYQSSHTTQLTYNAIDAMDGASSPISTSTKKVKGDPGWAATPGMLNTMTIFAQVSIGGTLVDAMGSSLACFKDGECRGQAYIFPGPGGM